MTAYHYTALAIIALAAVVFVGILIAWVHEQDDGPVWRTDDEVLRDIAVKTTRKVRAGPVTIDQFQQEKKI